MLQNYENKADNFVSFVFNFNQSKYFKYDKLLANLHELHLKNNSGIWRD